MAFIPCIARFIGHAHRRARASPRYRRYHNKSFIGRIESEAIVSEARRISLFAVWRASIKKVVTPPPHFGMHF